MKVRVGVACVLTLALGFLSSVSRADSTPQPMATLIAIVNQAVSSHAPRLVVPPGIYRGGPADGHGVVLTIQDAKDLTIVATGVTMVCTMRTRALEFDRCENVTLQGLTIDYDPLTFTQGTITAIAADDNSIDVTLDAGYPVAAYSRIDIVDPKTRFRENGMPFLWGTKAALVGPNVVRITLNGIGNAALVGDLASLNDGNEPGGVCHGIDFENCRGGMELSGLTLYCAPGMGIVEHGGAGGTKLIGVKIVPGPPPAGATAPRILTTSWDGILHSTVGHGPDVENCVIEDCGDDSWSDQSDPLLTVQSSGSQCVLAGGADLFPGDRLQHSLTSVPVVVQSSHRVPIAQAGLDPAIVAKLDSAPQWTLWSIDHNSVQMVTLAPGATLNAGDSVFSPDHQGNGFIFRNNYVYSSGRVLVKASDGLIENNTLIDGHNTVITPEVGMDAGFGIQNIIFRNNKIVGADNSCQMPWSSQAGAICAMEGGTKDWKATFAPAGSFANIDIEHNLFQDVDGVDIWLSSVQGVKISGNIFESPDHEKPSTSGASYGVDQTALIVLRNCSQVTIAGNKTQNAGTYEKTVLDSDATDTGITADAPTTLTPH